jgi:hypothetical protein
MANMETVVLVGDIAVGFDGELGREDAIHKMREYLGEMIQNSVSTAEIDEAKGALVELNTFGPKHIGMRESRR